ncbi:MAG: hypothetical protein KGL74_00480 [Elusimicrobia bacterium]|nr:hypothetical protein [Elusimicrobiota bacterium]
MSQWKAQKKYTARAVPNDHKEIGKKAYDVNIGDLGPTYVSLYIMQMSRTISVPLEDLILTEDAGWNRPLLIFKSDRWNLFGEHWQSWGG